MRAAQTTGTEGKSDVRKNVECQNVTEKEGVRGGLGNLSNMYVIENTTPKSTVVGIGIKKGEHKNKGFTQNVVENKWDIDLTHIKFSSRPECL